MNPAALSGCEGPRGLLHPFHRALLHRGVWQDPWVELGCSIYGFSYASVFSWFMLI